ncbi:serine/threonine dehydratase [Microbacterium sp.]|uniref:serine/threonine dehydratase n=1 Tax=Microbacterium sp. TaxID=51671 RepID=UPI0028112C5F|nr:serine/threonine dehydratase [Microbacterium sp.]
MGGASQLGYVDVEAATRRIRGCVRRVAVARVHSGEAFSLHLALEFMQFTGSFKARGAQNHLRAHAESQALPQSGVAIASGGNGGMAFAWAARSQGVPATVFVPAATPAVKVARLRSYGADVRVGGSEFQEAVGAARVFAEDTGALLAHAYDDVLMAAGAGTLLDELHTQLPELDTVVVSVGGGGLFAGVTTAARHRGVRTVSVEPVRCRALYAAIEAGAPVDVDVDSIAADSLGARRVSEMAWQAAQHPLVDSVLVTDDEIVHARQSLWDDHRLAVEHGAAAALAGIRGRNGYRPGAGESVCVVLCGANTDVSSLAPTR